MPAETEIVTRLRAAGCVFAEDEARLLVEASDDDSELDRLVARRAAGEPLEYVLGWAEFAGLRIRVLPGVFVPRRRTELLATEAARLATVAVLAGHDGRAGAAARDAAVSAPVVVDLCCGTGAIGAAVMDAAGPVHLVAADLDPIAVQAARMNLEPQGGLVFEGDLYDALPVELRARIDVLAVNAPYVPSEAIAMMPPEARDHEARLALDGGDDGLDVHRRVAASARSWLAPGGSVLIETSERQAPVARALFEAGGLATRILHDADADATVVIGVRDPVG
ncbi:putative protein N(5)-glutamine methyltransferase [Agromyces badenianii]|uniref:putative protein N(5)-glutamine methyltransferase n=1 Tax=Agromyces badenianii TaxID=2080742 RepID=UPI000D58CC80|nr:putative protein N(5)-glutamine methyltransferase [Agromyces badenianii]PWC02976.1 putative protein N(5)-glutamine methyltransferase [Agromyces badenianii]